MNAVTSYVFWNLHEPERGVYDFSGRRNITRFLQEAHDAGLLSAFSVIFPGSLNRKNVELT